MLFKILHQLWGDINRSVQDFCDIETVDNNTLVANDGSLATILKLGGFKTLMSAKDVEDVKRILLIMLDLSINLIRGPFVAVIVKQSSCE